MIVDDIRVGIRRATRSTGSSVFIILLLAIAIAINACVFSVVYGMLWKPLPYPSQDRLVQLSMRSVKMGIDLGWSIPYLDAVSRNTQQLSEVAGYQRKEASISDVNGTRPDTVNVLMAEPNLFSLLSVRPEIGRLLVADDAKAGADPVVLVGSNLWQSRLGKSSQVLEQRINIEGKVYRIVGVLPDSFSFSDRSIQVWIPMGFSEAELSLDNAGSFGSKRAVARLQGEATQASAASEMAALIRNDQALKGIADQIDLQVSVLPLRSIWLAGRDKTLKSILIAAILVFGVTIANIYNLFMLRLLRRRQEFALLEAVGATRAHLSLQIIVEAVALSFAATLLAASVVPLGITLLRHYDVLPDGVPQEIGFDLQTVLSIVAMFVCSAALMTLSSLAFRGQKVYEVLRQTGNGQTASSRVQKVRQGLVIGQVAATFVLLFGTALLVRSSHKLLGEEVGFDRTQQLVATLQPSTAVEVDPATVRSQIGAWMNVMEQSPGIQAVGLSSSAPFSENVTLEAFSGNSSRAGTREELPKAYISYINAAYPRAIGLTILKGRSFTTAETDQQAPVALVDEDLASRYFPGANPQGMTIRVTDSGTGELVAATVVGVVSRIRQRTLINRDEYSSIYLPSELPFALPGIPLNSVETVIRADQPLLASSSAEKALSNISANLRFTQVTTMESRISNTIIDVLRLNSLLKILSIITIIITSVGLYALMSHAVATRSREFGIRQALGASARDLLVGVLAQGGRLLTYAFAIGLPLALLLGSVLKSRLHEVSAYDPISIVVVSSLLIGIGMLANLLPAYRASRVKPIEALRSE